VKLPDGTEQGWQAKFTTSPVNWQSLFGQMEKSLRTVASKRPNCRKLTFCISVDMPEVRTGGETSSARAKFEKRKETWRAKIDGADAIAIDILTAGNILERLASDPHSRGKVRFFFNEEIFSTQWCSDRLAETERAAGERYSPDLHIDLPVSFAVEGLARSAHFCDRYAARRRAVSKLRPRLDRDFTRLGVTTQLTRLRAAVASWCDHVPKRIMPSEPLLRGGFESHCTRLRAAIEAAYPQASLPSAPGKSYRLTEAQRKIENRRRDLEHELRVISRALYDFEMFLSNAAAQAADTGALLMTGEAGQGKTHLFCDAGKRAIANGQPAIVLLCGEFSGKQPWNDIASLLGLGSVGWEELFGAMEAAGQAAGAPFLLLLDALNEASEPRGWQTALPALFARVDSTPWISIGCSVRSSYRPAVLPQDGLGDRVAEIEHSGFQGRELQAMERFFDTYGLAQPVVPLLTPEFTNPLFLKLYCEGLKGMGPSAMPPGSQHVTEVFDRYLDWRSQQVENALALNPAVGPVRGAINDLAEAMANTGYDVLPYAQAEDLLNHYAPGQVAWPKTMTGQLLAGGLLASDLWWNPATGSREPVIRFAFQRFSDYLVTHALLSPYLNVDAFRDAVKSSEPLRQTLLLAPAGWVEAFSVCVPERFGIELLDAARWNLSERRRRTWDRALVSSVVSRRPDAVSERTIEWLRKTRTTLDDVWHTLLSVAPIPEHPLNGDHLHRRLLGRDMPTRDLEWTIPMGYTMDEQGPLHRLVRWFCRGPHPECPDDILRLAAIPVVWALTSNVHLLRDSATKGLATSMAGRDDVVCSLIEEFSQVDDAYVLERLAVAVHGALLLEPRPQKGCVRVAESLASVVLGAVQSPNILARDAVRGCFEVCLSVGAISQTEYDTVCPPYGAAPPARPGSAAHLKRKYGWRVNESGNYIFSGYSTIYDSLFDMGDFGRYIVGTRVDDFSNVPRSKQRPAKRARKEYRADIANRWIMERVVSLGWTPERFKQIDDGIGRRYGLADDKKSERIGKKYQWIALRELLARIADNYHWRQLYDDGPEEYQGAWQVGERDIDPTLPAAPRIPGEDDDDVYQIEPTFPPDTVNAWWLPGGPRFEPDDPRPSDDWAGDTSDVPRVEDLLIRTDHYGHGWVVLQGSYNWDEPSVDDMSDGKRRRDLWIWVRSWIVPEAESERVCEALSTRSIAGGWLPEPPGMTTDAYLGEMPWAAAARPYDTYWQYRREEASIDAVSLIPAWAEYSWGAGGRDGSIADSVLASTPAWSLFQGGKLSWEPRSRRWLSAEGDTVAEYRESRGDRRAALLVRQDWLDDTLVTLKSALVVGYTGEKHLFEGRWHPEIIGHSTQLDAVSVLQSGEWRIGQRREKWR
jgi:hypothetical protein